MKHFLILSTVLAVAALLIHLDRLDALMEQTGKEIIQLQQHAIGVELRLQKAEQHADEAIEVARAVRGY